MPIDLLRDLACRRLPCWIDDPVMLDQLRLLRAAELVALMFVSTPPSAASDGPGSRAHVLAITQRGWRVTTSSNPDSVDTVLAEKLPDDTG